MKNKKRSVITVRRADSEIKIYTLRTAGGYESYQCSWYDMGGRRTKTLIWLSFCKRENDLSWSWVHGLGCSMISFLADAGREAAGQVGV